jgi:hypothetical protein
VIRRTFLLLLVAIALLRSAVPASAQARSGDPTTARWHLGPVALDPRFALRNVGLDSNVFNEAQAPTRDVTASFGPEMDSWLRLGRVGLAATSTLTWNYFRESRSQRSFDGAQQLRADLDLQWLVPHASGSIERARQRPNLEIDTRVRRDVSEVGAGVDVRLGPRLSIDLAHEVRRYEFSRGDAGGEDLADALNRREAETTATGRLAVTPLTTVVVKASVRKDRFDQALFRDSQSVAVMPGVEFKPLALISGTAAVGIRHLKPDSGEVGAFRGFVSDVALNYQLRDLMRVSVLARRDVEYSFEAGQPYYLSNGLRLSLTQALGAGWDVVVHGGRTTLDYRASIEGTASAEHRLDRLWAYGLGVGRRLGDAVRIGVDIEQVIRESTAAGRGYDGLRSGGSLTYGF